MKNELDDDSLKRIKDLETFFSDDEPNYENITNLFGLDISKLEDDMTNLEQKLSINYSVSNQYTIYPKYAYPTDSGFDLYSTEEIIIEPLGRSLVPTGLHLDIPDGYEIQVRSKSGLALKQGLMVLNSPGTVDQGYTGEIQVIIFNTTKDTIKIEKSQKIAQAVLCPVVCGKWLEFVKVDDINKKDRNSNGFGSTGI